MISFHVRKRRHMKKSMIYLYLIPLLKSYELVTSVHVCFHQFYIAKEINVVILQNSPIHIHQNIIHTAVDKVLISFQ